MDVESPNTKPSQASPVADSSDQQASPPEVTLLGCLAGFALRMCLLFVMYVLSIGPFYWQWYGPRFAGAGSPILAAFYEPLFLLAAWIPPLGHWIDWYVNLWIA